MNTAESILKTALTIPKTQFEFTREPKYLTWQDKNGTVHVEVEHINDKLMLVDGKWQQETF